jgi:hypothetical protein
MAASCSVAQWRITALRYSGITVGFISPCRKSEAADKFFLFFFYLEL